MSGVTGEPERAFRPLPPNERPIRRRRAARVIVRSGGKLLMELDSDPGLPGVAWWTTPGGGLEPDETYRQAATRELAEETGLRVEPSDLVGPIAHRLITHGFSDEILIQDEQFFAVDVAPFTPHAAAFTPAETRTLLGFAWLDADDLRADARAALSLTPEDVAAFLAADANTFLEYGALETSTVPVAPDDPLTREQEETA